MNNKMWVVGGLVAAIVSTLACGNTGSSAGAGAGPGGEAICDPKVSTCAACVSDGNMCESAAQCCSFDCGATGFCSPAAPDCREVNHACNTDSDCCSKTCATVAELRYCGTGMPGTSSSSGTMTTSSAMSSTSSGGSCLPDASICNSAADCCTLFCDSFSTCGCDPSGGPCNIDTDCCNEFCCQDGDGCPVGSCL